MSREPLDHLLEPGECVVGRVVVARVENLDGGMRDLVLTDDGYGQDLDVPVAVGMLAVASHLMLCGEGE